MPIPTAKPQMQCNPIIVDGILYGSSPKLKIFALDAATGKKLWMFDPNAKINYGMNFNRGVTYWTDGTLKRIFFAAGPELFLSRCKKPVSWIRSSALAVKSP